ncbi:hypothetical protein RPMA_08870 [Tardiphaga alba]|uniref:Uncharacterized protein n=1 Tax=Tardiphaga alba TaxID=340268 RepID=A0ABX8A9G5_9BRAD|nr:hypothetical protein [Tardiphaga alba]QUS38925.1 hypothetical protein RPMA_08870 [Tardiphaga alba]
MLPGIRFLCAAVILAVSLVVFGMGAAALLRSAHEEFASLPNRRPPPATVFSRQPEPTPTLAMLRVEPRLPEVTAPAAPEQTAVPVTEVKEPTPAPERVATAVAPVPEPEVTAAQPPAAEPEKPAAVEVAVARPSEADAVVAAAPVETPLPAEVAPQTPPASEPETTASISLPSTATIMDMPNATLTAEDAKLSSSKVAVLGGPPIDTEPVPLPNARPTAETPKAKPVQKKVVKKPAVKRRPVAQRAAPVTAAAQPNDPFGLSQLR